MASRYLGDLENRRDEIKVRIEELNVELNHLNAIIRQQAVAVALLGKGIPVTKKNIRFLEITGLVRQFLNERFLDKRGAGLRAREIYHRIIRDHIDLKYSTLRSYIHRLKKEEMIYQNRHGGPWHLTEHREKTH